jgi:hypothetical protein
MPQQGKINSLPWNPGILAIHECNVLISPSGPFVQHLEKNTPEDNMQMDFILWLAQDILEILVLLLRALLLVLLNEKDTKLEQAVHTNLLQRVWQWINTMPTRPVDPVFVIAKWDQWELEHCRCIKKFANPVLWTKGIFDCETPQR